MRSSITCPSRTELVADCLGLPHQCFQDDVASRCSYTEVAAEDLRRRLQLAVDAAVALLQPRRVPRQVDMDEIMSNGFAG